MSEMVFEFSVEHDNASCDSVRSREVRLFRSKENALITKRSFERIVLKKGADRFITKIIQNELSRFTKVKNNVPIMINFPSNTIESVLTPYESPTNCTSSKKFSKFHISYGSSPKRSLVNFSQ